MLAGEESSAVENMYQKFVSNVEAEGFAVFSLFDMLSVQAQNI